MFETYLPCITLVYRARPKISRTLNWGRGKSKAREGLADVIMIHEIGVHTWRESASGKTCSDLYSAAIARNKPQAMNTASQNLPVEI